MTSVEEPETPSAEVPAGNPDELAKSPTALKDAQEQMANLDVLICGQCHSAFHFIEEFKEHRDSNSCTSKSPVRDSTETKAQVWAFLLWKCSSARDCSAAGPSGDNSWKLYQQWCRMPEAQRNAWIAAGTNVQSLSKYAHAKVLEVKTDDQQVPVQTPVVERKVRGRPRKNVKVEDSETQPSGEESDDFPKSNLINKTPTPIKKTPAVQTTTSKAKLLVDKESVRNAQERVPPEERIARRTERGDGDSTGTEAGEYVVEKILAKRFNPRRKQYEYLLKWQGYPHEQNTWEPVENMETCKHLLEAFEKQLARQKELKALRAQQPQHPVQVRQISTPLPQIVKQVVKKDDTPALTPTGRLQRSSKVRALDQVKAWCGAEEEPAAKRVKREVSSDDDEDLSESSKGEIKKVVNGQSSPKGSGLDPDLVKSLGLSGKGMPNIKGVIKVDPKHMPNLSTGVYIMSKSSGIMKIDSPGKLGPGLNIDQEVIRKQILAAKQKKMETEKGKPSLKGTPAPTQLKRTFVPGQQMTEKTIITPSGQKIIQRTIHRSSAPPDGRSPVNILNKKLAQNDNISLLRRSGGTPRGRGRGGYSISTAGGNIVRIREKPASFMVDFEPSDASSDTSDGIEDPFPKDLGPIPSPSPERELTLCPITGKRLARAEGEPTPPPTPSPPPTPPPASPTPTQPLLMKVEMSPGGTTGMLVQGESAQPSLPVLTDEDGTEVKVEANTVKQLLGEGVGVDESEEVGLLHAGHPPIMIRGEDGVLYQVAGENEAGQTLLVAAEGVHGTVVEGVDGSTDGDDNGVVYVTRDDGQDVLAIDPSQLAQLMPGGEPVPALQQVTVQVEGEPGEDATQVIAQLVQAEMPSPGGTRRVVLLLPDGSFTMTELDKEQYESITEGKVQE
ncbi:Chromo domain protein LHP1 [Eumeta japonica]|uniref:Chromo domain protein LHP1 n=1 Tax=Eumeta variegata TaxID=151549 RepID=A0A4C1U7T1_EUMVA|nr:Chromo domain protein LHP1 [Eumeta japonica]